MLSRVPAGIEWGDSGVGEEGGDLVDERAWVAGHAYRGREERCGCTQPACLSSQLINFMSSSSQSHFTVITS